VSKTEAPTQMLPVPDLDRASMVFGDIKHMPKFDTLPEEFRRERSLFCKSAESWFFRGAAPHANGINIEGVAFTAKPGVDAGKALRAIKSVLSSWEPKHEHKIAACGFMLSQWFDREPAAPESRHE
jgi:hypothetical protein